MADAESPEPLSGILYVDTSALLKLLVREAESQVIESELLRWDKLATSIITEVELPRAVARAHDERPDAVIDGSVVCPQKTLGWGEFGESASGVRG